MTYLLRENQPSWQIVRDAALEDSRIKDPQGSVQLLLAQRQWIYPSIRVNHLLKKLKGEEDLHSIFNAQHHIQSALCLFKFLKNESTCVFYGHKAQGKTQFLFFVFKLLQAMGEKALFFR